MVSTGTANETELKRMVAEFKASLDEANTIQADLESGLKFSATWVLSCLTQICDPKKCYNLNPQKMKLIDLLEDLSIGSQLGKLLLIKGVGRRTVEHMVSRGIETVEGLVNLSEDDLINQGVQSRQAVSIARYVRRRSR